jgi:hypothetical protein
MSEFNWSLYRPGTRAQKVTLAQADHSADSAMNWMSTCGSWGLYSAPAKEASR